TCWTPATCRPRSVWTPSARNAATSTPSEATWRRKPRTPGTWWIGCLLNWKRSGVQSPKRERGLQKPSLTLRALTEGAVSVRGGSPDFLEQQLDIIRDPRRLEKRQVVNLTNPSLAVHQKDTRRVIELSVRGRTRPHAPRLDGLRNDLRRPCQEVPGHRVQIV